MRALEGFGGRGALLPEQVWDEDNPANGMRLGMPTGSAMPLAWAHAEYIRLVRSIRDGAAFDRIAPVAERYLAARGRTDLEVWKPTRHAQRVARGATLRIQVPGPFRLRWTRDEWQTSNDTLAADSGPRRALRRPRDPAGAGGAGALHVLLDRATSTWATFRRAAATWEGADYSVEVG